MLRIAALALVLLAGAKTPHDAVYRFNGGHFKERYTLARNRGIWRITGSKIIP